MTINQLPELVTHDGSPAVPAVYNGADYKLPLGNMILVKEVSGTTNSSGNLGLGAGAGGISHFHVVLAAIRKGTSGICTPLYNVSTDEWSIHVTSAGATPSAVTNTSVTLLVFYLPTQNFDTL